jgi:hypothetical protein
MSIWPVQPPESTAYPFNRDERARLTIYRLAVAAGFYREDLTGLPGGQSADSELRSQNERSNRRDS